MRDMTYNGAFPALTESKDFSILRSNTAQIILSVFIATLFFSKSEEYRLFRIVYSIFLYISLFKLTIFYIESSIFEIKIPTFYKIYLVIVVIFLICNFIFDVKNPEFNIIYQINNPYGFLAVLNILGFGLGSTTKNLDGFLKILFIITIIFVFFCFVPDLPKFQGFHGYICSYAIIPFFIIARHFNKHKWYSYVLVGLACMFSISSDYRIITFRVLMFFGLFVSLTMVKQHSFLKFLILLITCTCVYQFLANLTEILEFFGSFIKIQSFEVDTRSFLYREIFQDFAPSEIITGRGFSGTYFSSWFFYNWNNPEEIGVSFDRITLEVGFLQLLLKGGFIYYLLFIIPLFISSLKGILGSGVKPLPFAISIYIFSELLLMFIENIPNFGFHFFNLFFLAGFVYNSIKEDRESIGLNNK